MGIRTKQSCKKGHPVEDVKITGFQDRQVYGNEILAYSWGRSQKPRLVFSGKKDGHKMDERMDPERFMAMLCLAVLFSSPEHLVSQGYERLVKTLHWQEWRLYNRKINEAAMIHAACSE